MANSRTTSGRSSRPDPNGNVIDLTERFAKRGQVEPGAIRLVVALKLDNPSTDEELLEFRRRTIEANQYAQNIKDAASKWIGEYEWAVAIFADRRTRELYLSYLTTYSFPSSHGPASIINALKNEILYNEESFSFGVSEGYAYTRDQLATFLRHLFERSKFDVLYQKSAFIVLYSISRSDDEVAIVAYEKLDEDLRIEIAKQLFMQKLKESSIKPKPIYERDETPGFETGTHPSATAPLQLVDPSQIPDNAAEIVDGPSIPFVPRIVK